VRVRWLRFQVARLASLLLSVAVFPVLAPLIGTSPAYWSLLAAGAAANFCLDRYWSFRPDRRRPAYAAGLARPTQPRSGHSSTWAGFQGSTPSICLASAGLPGVTAKIAESAEARAESCKISTTVHKLGGVRR